MCPDSPTLKWAHDLYGAHRPRLDACIQTRGGMCQVHLKTSFVAPFCDWGLPCVLRWPVYSDPSHLPILVHLMGSWDDADLVKHCWAIPAPQYG